MTFNYSFDTDFKQYLAHRPPTDKPPAKLSAKPQLNFCRPQILSPTQNPDVQCTFDEQLRYLCVATPEQNLQTLKALTRHQMQCTEEEPAILTELNDALSAVRAEICEHFYMKTWKPTAGKKEDLQILRSQEIRRDALSQLAMVQLTAKHVHRVEKMMDRDPKIQAVVMESGSEQVCEALVTTDEVCQELSSDGVSSPKLSLYYASLTGNVSFLFQALLQALKSQEHVLTSLLLSRSLAGPDTYCLHICQEPNTGYVIPELDLHLKQQRNSLEGYHVKGGEVASVNIKLQGNSHTVEKEIRESLYAYVYDGANGGCVTMVWFNPLKKTVRLHSFAPKDSSHSVRFQDDNKKFINDVLSSNCEGLTHFGLWEECSQDLYLTFIQNGNLITVSRNEHKYYLNASSHQQWSLKLEGDEKIYFANFEVTRRRKVTATSRDWAIEGLLDGDSNLVLNLICSKDSGSQLRTLKGKFVDKHRTKAKGEDWTLELEPSSDRLLQADEEAVSLKIHHRKAFVCLRNSDTKQERLKVVPLSKKYCLRYCMPSLGTEEDRPLVLRTKPANELHRLMNSSYPRDEVEFKLKWLDGMCYYLPATELERTLTFRYDSCTDQTYIHWNDLPNTMVCTYLPCSRQISVNNSQFMFSLCEKTGRLMYKNELLQNVCEKSLRDHNFIKVTDWPRLKSSEYSDSKDFVHKILKGSSSSEDFSLIWHENQSKVICTTEDHEFKLFVSLPSHFWKQFVAATVDFAEPHSQIRRFELEVLGLDNQWYQIGKNPEVVSVSENSLRLYTGPLTLNKFCLSIVTHKPVAQFSIQELRLHQYIPDRYCVLPRPKGEPEKFDYKLVSSDHLPLDEMKTIAAIDRYKVLQVCPDPAKANQKSQNKFFGFRETQQSNPDLSLQIGRLIQINATEYDQLTPFKWLHLRPSKLLFETIDQLLSLNLSKELYKLLHQCIIDNVTAGEKYRIPETLSPTSFQKLFALTADDPDMQISMQRYTPPDEQFTLYRSLLSGEIDLSKLRPLNNEQLKKAYLCILPHFSTLTNDQKSQILAETKDYKILNEFLHAQVFMTFEINQVEKAENYDEKGFLVTQSELLSGGVSTQELDFLSSEGQNTVRFYLGELQISNEEPAPVKSNLWLSLIHSGKDTLTDDIVTVFQAKLLKQRRVTAMLGGQVGTKLGRAAFAVMLKLNELLQSTYSEFYDHLEMACGIDYPQEPGAQKDADFAMCCEQMAHFDKLYRVWVSAAQMRNWLQAKKSSIGNKYRSEDEEARQVKESEHLDDMVRKVTEKAEFLIKLEPASEAQSQTKIIEKLQQRQKSNSRSEATTPANDQIRDFQAIKQQASLTSVLSCLQTRVLKSEIQNQVEHNYVAAVRRYSNLCHLLQQLQLDPGKIGYLVQKLLQLQVPGKPASVMSDIQGGCNSQLESKIRQVFFQVLQTLCQRLRVTKSSHEFVLILRALQWQYTARDFLYLHGLMSVFTDCLKPQASSDYLYSRLFIDGTLETTQLRRSFVNTFADIYVTVLGRVSDVSMQSEMQLKKFGDFGVMQQVPKLQKARSLVESGITQTLFNEIVRTCQLYIAYFLEIDRSVACLSRERDSLEAKLKYEEAETTLVLADVLFEIEPPESNTAHTENLRRLIAHHDRLLLASPHLKASFAHDTIPLLLKLLKVLSSGACFSDSLSKLLVNTDYGQLLSLLLEVEQKSSQVILSILTDFKQLNLISSAQLQDTLVNFARSQLQLAHYDSCLQACRLLQPVPLPDDFIQKNEVDQILWLTLHGVELNYVAVGDPVKLVNQVKPYQENLVIYKSKSGKEALCYSQSTGQVHSILKDHIEPCTQTRKIELEPKQIQQLLESETTSAIVKVLLLKSTTVETLELESWLVKVVTADYTRSELDWLAEHKTFCAREMEEKIAKNLKHFLNCAEMIKFEPTLPPQRRNLVKLLFKRPLTRKQCDTLAKKLSLVSNYNLRSVPQAQWRYEKHPISTTTFAFNYPSSLLEYEPHKLNHDHEPLMKVSYVDLRSLIRQRAQELLFWHVTAEDPRLLPHLRDTFKSLKGAKFLRKIQQKTGLTQRMAHILKSLPTDLQNTEIDTLITCANQGGKMTKYGLLNVLVKVVKSADHIYKLVEALSIGQLYDCEPLHRHACFRQKQRFKQLIKLEQIFDTLLAENQTLLQACLENTYVKCLLKFSICQMVGVNLYQNVFVGQRIAHKLHKANLLTCLEEPLMRTIEYYKMLGLDCKSESDMAWLHSKSTENEKTKAGTLGELVASDWKLLQQSVEWANEPGSLFKARLQDVTKGIACLSIKHSSESKVYITTRKEVTVNSIQSNDGNREIELSSSKDRLIMVEAQPSRNHYQITSLDGWYDQGRQPFVCKSDKHLFVQKCGGKVFWQQSIVLANFEGTLREVHENNDHTFVLVNTDGWLYKAELHNEEGTDSFFTDADERRVNVVMEALSIEGTQIEGSGFLKDSGLPIFIKGQVQEQDCVVTLTYGSVSLLAQVTPSVLHEHSISLKGKENLNLVFESIPCLRVGKLSDKAKVKVCGNNIFVIDENGIHLVCEDSLDTKVGSKSFRDLHYVRGGLYAAVTCDNAVLFYNLKFKFVKKGPLSIVQMVSMRGFCAYTTASGDLCCIVKTESSIFLRDKIITAIRMMPKSDEDVLLCVRFEDERSAAYRFTAEQESGFEEIGPDFRVEHESEKSGWHVDQIDEYISIYPDVQVNCETLLPSFTFFTRIQASPIVEYSICHRAESEKAFTEKELSDYLTELNDQFKKTKFRDIYDLVTVKKMRLSAFINFNELTQARKDIYMAILKANEVFLRQYAKVAAEALNHPYGDLDLLRAFMQKWCLQCTYNIAIKLTVKRNYPQKLTHNNGYPLERVSDSQEDRDEDLTITIDRLSDNETIYDQMYKKLSRNINLLRGRNPSDQPFRIKFIGEKSLDYGGPFRDCFEMMCQEITERFLQPTGNMVTNIDEVSYQPQVLTEVSDLEHFYFLGTLIGWALNSTTFSLSLDLNPIFWKSLFNEPILLDDIRLVDKHRHQLLMSVRTGEYQTMFEADLGDGVEQELCEGGATIPVTESNREEFIKLYTEKYFERDRLIYSTIAAGVKRIVSPQILNLLTPQSAPKAAFAATRISAKQLISQLKCDEADDPAFELFKEMIRSFTYNERQALLKFITGSSRLGLSRQVQISLVDEDDEQLPVAHTCNEELDLPKYSSLEIMTQKVKLAICLCGEIDDDVVIMSNSNSVRSSYRGEESDSSHSREASFDDETSNDQSQVSAALRRRSLSVQGSISVPRLYSVRSVSSQQSVRQFSQTKYRAGHLNYDFNCAYLSQLGSDNDNALSLQSKEYMSSLWDDDYKKDSESGEEF